MAGSAWNPGGSVINVDSESTNISQRIVASAAQTLLTISAFTYVPNTGAITVYRGGQKLIKDHDYQETDSTHVTLLLSDVTEGEVFEVVGIIGATGANVVLAQAAADAAIAAAATIVIPTGDSVVSKTGDTGSIRGPVGTTAQRDVSPEIGFERFNIDTGRKEVWTGTAWLSSGGATGGGNDDVFYENSKIVTADYTITSGKNAMSAGPITIADGVTVTIPDGSTWSIV